MSTSANHMCVYNKCLKNNRFHKDISFFKFPVKNCERAEEWKKNCGNNKIALMNVSSLGHKLICENHFLSTDIMINNKRKLLIKSAVPIKYIEAEDEAPEEPCLSPPTSATLKTYGRKRSDAELSSASDNNQKLSKFFGSFHSTQCKPSNVSDPIPNTPLTRDTLINENTKKTVCKPKPLQRKLKKKRNSFSTMAVLNGLLLNQSESTKTFVRMLCLPKTRHVWTRAEKQLALSLYSKSSSTYKFMLYKLKFNLPSMRVIISWLKVSGVKTKLTKKL